MTVMCVCRELINAMHADMYKTVHTVLLNVRHPSTPMLVASVCHVIQTALSPQDVPDRWTLSVLERVTRVLSYILMMSTACRQ